MTPLEKLDLNQTRNQFELQFTPRGLVFFECAAREQLFGGAKQGSKTVTLCQKAAMLSHWYPGNRGMLMRQSFTDCRDSVIETFFKICPDDLILDHNKGEHKILIKTDGPPSTILYHGAGDVVARKAAEKRKGFILGWFGIDEATEVAQAVYDMINAQLTWTCPGWH